MTDHAPSVVAPETHNLPDGSPDWPRRAAWMLEWMDPKLRNAVRAALRAESVAAPSSDDFDDEEWDDMTEPEKRAVVADLRVALHAPPALDAARDSEHLVLAGAAQRILALPVEAERDAATWNAAIHAAAFAAINHRAATPASGEPAAPREEQP